jgi:DNA-binding Xre family transcriptional regulator
MPISYSKLFLLLEEQGKNKYWLRQNGIHPNTVDRLIKGSPISTEIIERLCKLLNCKIEDIMEYIPENKEEE